MKTWKSRRKVCRSRKSGKFAFKGKCSAYKRQKVRALAHALFKLVK